MRKGVTPIIAIVILLLITVALAGTAWSYLSGFTSTQTSKTFEVPSGGAGATCRNPGDCDPVANGIQNCNQFLVLVTNTGQDALKIDDFVIREIDGKTSIPYSPNTVGHNFPVDGITIGEGATIMRMDCWIAPNNCTAAGGATADYIEGEVKGLHTIRLGTSGVTKTLTVSCPG